MASRDASLGFVLVVILLICNGILGQGQTWEEGRIKDECLCDVALMDSVGAVWVEPDLELSSTGPYYGLVTSLCTLNQTIHVQIWRQVTENSVTTYKFQWETIIETRTANWVSEVFMFGEAITFDPLDRIGLFTREATVSAIPCSRQVSAGDVYTSTKTFDGDHSFTTNDNITLNDRKWPRRFTSFMALCVQPDCSPSNPDSLLPLYLDSFDNLVGEKEDPIDELLRESGVGTDTTDGEVPQPPAPPPGPLPPISIKCEVPDVTKKLIDTGNLVVDLQATVELMLDQMSNLTNSSFITGICPVHTLAGDGTGSCYVLAPEKLTMATAEIACQVNHDGHLVSIETEAEEAFLRQSIVQRAFGFRSREKDNTLMFWTSGLYSFTARPQDWYWYNEPRDVGNVTYRNWAPDTSTLPRLGSRKICLALNTNPGAATSNWQAEDCQKFKYYICEVPKRCL